MHLKMFSEHQKGAANTLLGKTYLYMEKWAESATAFEAVIGSNEYQLQSDYSTLFLKESVVWCRINFRSIMGNY